MIRISRRPLVAVMQYDADQEQPVEPMTLVETRKYKMPLVMRRYDGELALEVRKHAGAGAKGNGGNGGSKDGNDGGDGTDKGSYGGGMNGGGVKNGGGAKNAGGAKSDDVGKNDDGGAKSADGEKGNGNAEKKEEAAGNGGGAKQEGGETFTAQQDAMIISMKADGKTWQEIGIALGGRSKKTAQNRHKELTKDGGAEAAKNDDAGEARKDEGAKNKKNGIRGGGDKGGEKKEGSQKQNGDKKQGKVDKAAAAEKKPTPTKAASKTSSRAHSDVRFTKGEWMTLMEDDMFSFGELQCLSELLVQDEQQRWLRVASRFRDITGRRLHPDDVREKFGEMGNMGR